MQAAMLLTLATALPTLPPETPDPAPPGSVRVAGLVVRWVRGDKEANYRRVEKMIREAAAKGAGIVVTTECFLDGYAIADRSIPLDEYRALGEPIPDGVYFKKLAALAAELKIYIVAGMTEADGDERYNAVVLIGPDGRLIGKYRKQNLGHELGRNTPGKLSPVFSTPFGKVGVMICADRTDPAIVRRFCDRGADFLICPSGGMFGPKSNDPIVQSRSRENKVHIVFVHPVEFLVTGPDGGVLKRALTGENLLVTRAERDGKRDQRHICYFDLPVASGPDPFQTINQKFRLAHFRARKELLAKAGPVILLNGDELVLVRKGKRQEVKFVPQLYHDLKVVAHVPLAIYLLLAPYGDGEISVDRLEGLADYHRQIAVLQSLTAKRFPDDLAPRQERILTTSARFLDIVLDKKQVGKEKLTAFTRGLSKLVMANGRDAAFAQLDALDKQVQAWKKQMPADDWQKLHVVIQGSALPRKGNLAVEYFAQRLGEKGEGLRIIYAESLFDEARALNLLGASLVDTGIGTSFFDDPLRMHRDLLQDVATEWLRKADFEK